MGCGVKPAQPSFLAAASFLGVIGVGLVAACILVGALAGITAAAFVTAFRWVLA